MLGTVEACVAINDLTWARTLNASLSGHSFAIVKPTRRQQTVATECAMGRIRPLRLLIERRGQLYGEEYLDGMERIATDMRTR